MIRTGCAVQQEAAPGIALLLAARAAFGSRCGKRGRGHAGLGRLLGLLGFPIAANLTFGHDETPLPLRCVPGGRASIRVLRVAVYDYLAGMLKRVRLIDQAVYNGLLANVIVGHPFRTRTTV